MAIERRPRLPDGSFGSLEKVGEGVTQSEKVTNIEADVEVVAETVLLNADDVLATAETVAILADLVLELQAQVKQLQGGNA